MKTGSHRVTESQSHESTVLPVKEAQTVRSDCWIEITKKSEGGAGSPSFNIKSKVGNLYGAAIRKQLEEMATFFNLRNVDITLEDAGALPFCVGCKI
jgi:citrate lyase gamma subunit